MSVRVGRLMKRAPRTVRRDPMNTSLYLMALALASTAAFGQSPPSLFRITRATFGRRLPQSRWYG